MTAKKLPSISLAELVKRVPPNQMEQFESFSHKTAAYHRRVNKYLGKLPTIDWDYYRKNVRDNYVKLVEEFRVKYEELDHSFAGRHEKLDHSKYYKELEQLTAKVQDEVKRYIDDSANRVKVFQEEIRRVRNLRYENMTLEQFVEMRDDIAQFVPCKGKALFWPHTPEEQLGYIDETVPKESTKELEKKTKNSVAENSEKKPAEKQDKPKS